MMATGTTRTAKGRVRAAIGAPAARGPRWRIDPMCPGAAPLTLPAQPATPGRMDEPIHTIIHPDRLAETIRLAITPVFLLTAIGAMLGVVTTRLGRAIDRARALEAEHATIIDADARARLVRELATLDRRIVLAHRAVSLSAAAALATCLLIAALFVAETMAARAAQLVPPLFIVVMALLASGLAAFLLEVRIATRNVRVRAELIRDAAPPRGDLSWTI